MRAPRGWSPDGAPAMIRRLVLVACLGTARAAGFSQSLVEQPDVSAETYTSDTGAACPMPNARMLHTQMLCCA